MHAPKLTSPATERRIVALKAAFRERREMRAASSERPPQGESIPRCEWGTGGRPASRSSTRRIVCIDRTTHETQDASPDASPQPTTRPMDAPDELEAVAKSLGLTQGLRPLTLSHDSHTQATSEILSRKPPRTSPRDGSGGGILYTRTQDTTQSTETPPKLSKSAKKRQKKKLSKQRQLECVRLPCVQPRELSPSASPAPPRLDEESLLKGLMGDKAPKNAVRFCEQGIQNLGNTCFLASALQLLIGSSHFCGLMLEMKTAMRVLDPIQYPFITAMGSLAQSLRVQSPTDPQRESLLSGESLRFAAIAPEMLSPIVSMFQARFNQERSIGGGQDVQEFLLFVLDHLEKEITQLRPALQLSQGSDSAEGDESWLVVGKKKKISVQRTTGVVESSVLSSIFGGTVESVVRAAGMVASVTTHSFTSLVLDIAPQTVQTVEDALDVYTAQDTIPDYRIQGTKGRVMASKSHVFKQLPAYLILCLKQYTYSPSGFEKLHKPIGFGSLLKFRRSWQSSGQPAVDYRLIATCNHHGQGHGGDHYTANVLQRGGRWVHFNDSRLKRTSVSVVLSETPYLLLYDRI